MLLGAGIYIYDPPHSLYDGTGTSTEVPGLYDVAINGRGYFVDWTVGIRPVSIPQVRQQADPSQFPGEGSLNPEELWRRTQTSWHRGAGQTFWDRDDSDPFRFNSSKGIYVFEPYQFTLLPDTAEKRDSANTNLALAVGSQKLYVADGTEVRYTSDVTVASPTWTDVTIQAGESALSVQSIASDGHNLYAALGGNGIHQSVNGAAAAHYNDLSANLVRWAKGRLMAADGSAGLYNVTASGAAPAALMTHDNTNFAWKDVTGGRGYIFAGGFSGDHSEIWKTAVKEDGTALGTPSPAGELPDGEKLRALQGYQGLILIGTDDGVRLAVEGDDGNLTIGALIDLGVSVRCFEPQGQFVWFGWTNYDGTSTGLGRLDLTQILPSGAPAYATDLMATAQGTVLSAATFQGIRVFGVSGAGFYAEVDNRVASGSINLGRISFGLPEDKTLMAVDVRHDDTGLGSVTPAISTDGGSFSSLAASSSGTGKRVGAANTQGEHFEPRITLARSSSDTTTGPTFTRLTELAEPNASSAYFLDVPIRLRTTHETPSGAPIHADPTEDFKALLDLRRKRVPVVYQLGDENAIATVWDFSGEMEKALKQDPATRKLVGTLVVRIKIHPPVS